MLVSFPAIGFKLTHNLPGLLSARHFGVSLRTSSAHIGCFNHSVVSNAVMTRKQGRFPIELPHSDRTQFLFLVEI